MYSNVLCITCRTFKLCSNLLNTQSCIISYQFSTQSSPQINSLHLFHFWSPKMLDIGSSNARYDGKQNTRPPKQRVHALSPEAGRNFNERQQKDRTIPQKSVEAMPRIGGQAQNNKTTAQAVEADRTGQQTACWEGGWTPQNIIPPTF